jgi:transcriptional regulator with XRE-family HTH domain
VTKTLKALISFRKLKGFTQASVARKMKVTRQQVSNIERPGYGDPSIRTIERYAKAMGLKIVVEFN